MAEEADDSKALTETSERSLSDGDTDTPLEERNATDTEPTKRRGFKRPIDESLLSEEEARRLEARRHYNRQCAAKARKRSKDLISKLQSQVEELTKDKAKFERSNEVMKAQLQLLEQQNRTLIANQRMQGPPAPGAGQFMTQGGLSSLQPNLLLQGQAPSSLGLPSSSFSLLESLATQNRFGITPSPATQTGGLPPGRTRQGEVATAGNAGMLDPKLFSM